MSLEEVLRKAIERIDSGSLTNEAQVKQAVIVPVLRELGWDDANPAEFSPEYPVPEGKVDYALLSVDCDPLVFIEAKRLGGMHRDKHSEEQVFGYISNKSVPLLGILTDGECWRFYLSMAEEPPPSRLFCVIELKQEHQITEYVEKFERYLQKNRVISGEACRAAEQLLENVWEIVKAKVAIRDTWGTLLETPDEKLCALLVKEVERACGIRPELKDVKDFLKEQSQA